eukprot:CAMPEP_0172161856 /NCGR_PEP_ID=MMETSP1050-20130122/6348_1 /TAXON_ID=233186 /ORGANISM="Cryptomonas curvata, Strain CCAP979/52" /LENGTH=979 /DNA_ID=CAMNT_0012831781 /DNA_START=1741 /DNA_END=4680 /DNA_ORIENTATION=-
MGKEDINTFQLLEFELKFNKVKKYHRDCILSLKMFWQVFHKHKKLFRSKKKYSETLVEKLGDILICLKNIERNTAAAHDGYRLLLDKFPRSVPLLYSFASFYDVVLNRPMEANQLRDRALMLDESPEDEDNESNLGQEHVAAFETAVGGMDEKMEGNPAKSTTSSSDGSVRSRMTRFFASWKDEIMGKELADLRRMHWGIFFATALIVACSTIGFSLTDSLLYESTAHANLDLIDRARPFRLDLIRSLFLARNLVMADIKNDTTILSTVKSQLNDISLEFSSAHLENFQLAPPSIIELYADEKWRIEVPTAGGWNTRLESLWHLGNEFSSQVTAASGMVLGDVSSYTNNLHGLDPSLRAIAFLNENCFQTVLPAFEQLGRAYVNEVIAFGALTHAMIWLSMSFNVTLIFLVSIYVLRSLSGVVQVLQHETVVVLLVLSTSRDSAFRIFNFYESAERALMEIEDGDAAKLMIEDAEYAVQEADTAPAAAHRDPLDQVEMHQHLENGESPRRQINGVTWHGDDVEDDESDVDIEAAVVFPSHSHNVEASHIRNLHQHSRDVNSANEIQQVKESEITCRPTSRQRLPAVVAAERISVPQRNLRPSSTFINRSHEANSKNTTTLQQEVKVSAEDNYIETKPRSQALARMRSAPKSIRRLKKLLSQQRPWYAQQVVHFITLMMMMMLCVLSIIYPVRNVDALVNVPAKENQAARRRYLHLACVHFARELALNDGFARLNSSELAAALRWSLDEFRLADEAIRIGGKHGVTTGDERGIASLEHNAFVYSSGCPWRANYSLGDPCSVSSMPEMKVHGLYGLLLTFADACENVLSKHLPESWGDPYRAPENASLAQARPLLDTDKFDSLILDPDLAFLIESFEGDLFLGLAENQNVVDLEHTIILFQLHDEGRMLYGIFIAQACFLFYFMIFRSTVLHSKKESVKTSNFIGQLPAFVLDAEEAEGMRSFFQNREYDSSYLDGVEGLY